MQSYMGAFAFVFELFETFAFTFKFPDLHSNPSIHSVNKMCIQLHTLLGKIWKVPYDLHIYLLPLNS